MNKPLSFFVKCVPPKSTAQASSRIIRRNDGSQFIGRLPGSAASKIKTALLVLFYEFVPPTPFTGPIRVRVVWTYPFRKSETKKNRALGWVPCDKRPDIDNLCKLFFDALTRLGFWEDDSQIAELTFVKGWGDRFGINVEIRPFDMELK